MVGLVNFGLDDVDVAAILAATATTTTTNAIGCIGPSQDGRSQLSKGNNNKSNTLQLGLVANDSANPAAAAGVGVGVAVAVAVAEADDDDDGDQHNLARNNIQPMVRGFHWPRH